MVDWTATSFVPKLLQTLRTDVGLNCLIFNNILVYLRTSPETCMQRIKARSRTEEKTLPMVGKNTKYYCFVAQERVNVGRNVLGFIPN